MLFNSIDFVLFLPIVCAVYFAIPHRCRWALLLAASYVFYAWWKVDYLLLLVLSTAIDYVAGLMMGRFEERRRRRPWLLISLCSNLGLLIGFKYLNFFSTSLAGLFHHAGFDYQPTLLNVLLPVGISFYTFQTLAYSIDVYRGKQQPERHLGIFALYVSFFPQLVAGPIERSQSLIPQFKELKTFEYQRVVDGLKLMAWGFFQKLVIADRLALYVNDVYGAPGRHSGIEVILATYFFAFQIYCDFSGYCDIAIGAARVMGYDLMDNFQRPYFSKSIAEFWRRWHISLSTWFRDYLYFPLGGNRVSTSRWYWNLLIVFLVSGLWHGAAWTFVLWGALHGTCLVLGLLTQRLRDRIWTVAEDLFSMPRLGYRAAGLFELPRIKTIRSYLSMFVTFHLVLISWVFFRAEHVSDIPVLFGRMVHLGDSTLDGITLELGQWGFMIAVGALALLLLVHLIERKQRIVDFLSARPAWARWIAYYVTVCAILLLGILREQQFIYFQF